MTLNITYSYIEHLGLYLETTINIKGEGTIDFNLDTLAERYCKYDEENFYRFLHHYITTQGEIDADDIFFIEDENYLAAKEYCKQFKLKNND